MRSCPSLGAGSVNSLHKDSDKSMTTNPPPRPSLPRSEIECHLKTEK